MRGAYSYILAVAGSGALISLAILGCTATDAPCAQPTQTVTTTPLEKDEHPLQWQESWYADGRLKQRTQYYLAADGKRVRHGVSRMYHPNGKPRCEEHWVEDKRHGLSLSWDQEGRKYQEEMYVGGEPDGVSRWWGQNGQLARETHYRLGREQGPHRTWHDNGQLEEHGDYLTGQRTGKWVAYDYDGRKRSDELFDEQGKAIGIHVWWENGEQVRRMDFSCNDGMVEETQWHSDGRSKLWQGLLRDGMVKDGTWTYWNTRGEVVATGQWKHGTPISGVCLTSKIEFVSRLPTNAEQWGEYKNGIRVRKVDVRFD